MQVLYFPCLCYYQSMKKLIYILGAIFFSTSSAYALDRYSSNGEIILQNIIMFITLISIYYFILVIFKIGHELTPLITEL